MNLVVDPPPTLKAFLTARASGASVEELKALQAADEEARANQPAARSRARAEPDNGVVIDLSPALRKRNRVARERDSDPES